MIKAKVGSGIIDIIDINKIATTTTEDTNRVGVIYNGAIYPLRNKTDSRTGIYSYGLFNRLVKNENDFENYQVNPDNMINFDDAKGIRDLLEKQNRVREMENSMLTSASGNIFVPLDKETDSATMKALKEAVRCKHIDINKYADAFGPNYNNDIRIFNKDDITQKKLIEMCNAMHIKVEMVLSDANENVPNPIGKDIRVVITGKGNNDTLESDEEE